MTKENQNFQMYSGETKLVRVYVVSDDPITGSEIVWVMKGSATTPLLRKTVGEGIVITGDRTFEITINATDTESTVGKFLHEARLTDGLGRVSVVTRGLINILPIVAV